MLKRGDSSKEQQDLLWSLIQNYNAIYYINLETDRFTVLYANHVVNQDVRMDGFEKKFFHQAMEEFAETYVRDEDKEPLLRLTDCDYVRKRLKKEDTYAFRYRVNPLNGLEFFEVCMAKPDEASNENYAIMTVRNCNKQAREEMAYQLEIEKRNTELSAALKAASEANKSRTDFFARMSHDLRTPMNVILGLTDLSADEADLARMRENMKKIHTAGEYLLSVINDSLDFQKIEAGGLRLKPEIVRTRELVGGITDLAIQANGGKNVDVRLRSKGVKDDSYLLVDPIRIKQIFVNLLSNAIKFTPEGGTVEITIEVVERESARVHDRITIADTGIGMSEDFLKNGLFKPFAQEYNALTAGYAGTGLGLSIAKQLLDLMGGTIRVESELGEGTQFTVDIDFAIVADEKAKDLIRSKAEKTRTLAPELEGIRVLLVEDHPLNAEIAAKLLDRAGCAVTWAENGKLGADAFRCSDLFHFDAVLMDVRMPVMNGVEAAKEIRGMDRKDAKAVPIIAMTANAYEEDRKASLEAGMNAHLAKPFNPQELYETIEKCVRQTKR
ncbi:MAG: ATP-binding protein [Oscillibacter sp.]|jgi:signal transduction histidine kinase/CheY-like chemotaxis protein|nr:ATP-binding protein [Oscillibacter sp.]